MAAVHTQFNALFDELIEKRLSSSGVEKIRDTAALSFHEPAPLVSAIVEAQKRATGATKKLAAFYLVDAIVRHARDVIKRKATGGYAYKDAKAPAGSDAEHGSKQAMIAGAKGFLEAIDDALLDLSLDAMRGVRAEQREKIYKIIDIWIKVEVSMPERLWVLRKAVEDLETELGPGETSVDAGKHVSVPTVERKKRDAATARKDKKRESASQKSNGSTTTQAAVTGKATPGSSSATATPEPTAVPGLPSHLLALLSGNVSGSMSPKPAAIATPPPEDGRLSPASLALQSEQPREPQKPAQPLIVPSTVLSSLANLLGTPANASTTANNPALNASQLALLQQLAASGSTPPQRPPQALPNVSTSAATSISSNAHARPPSQQQYARRPPPQQQQWSQRPPPPAQYATSSTSAPRPYPSSTSSTVPDYSKPPPQSNEPTNRPPPTTSGSIRPLGMVGHVPPPPTAAAQPTSARVEMPGMNTAPSALPPYQSSSTGIKRPAEQNEEDAKRRRSRSPQYAPQPPPQSGKSSGSNVPIDASVGDMSSFNLALFDATKPEAWTELAQRWYNTQGYVPNQQELLWWIMTLQQQQAMMAWQAQVGWNMGAQSDAPINSNANTAAPDSSAAAWGQSNSYAQQQQHVAPWQQAAHGSNGNGKREGDNGRPFEASEIQTG